MQKELQKNLFSEVIASGLISIKIINIKKRILVADNQFVKKES